MGDGQCPTAGDSRLRGTREPVQQATDAPTVEGASRARLLPRHIGHDFSFFLPRANDELHPSPQLSLLSSPLPLAEGPLNTARAFGDAL